MSTTLTTLDAWAARTQSMTFFVVGEPAPELRARAVSAGGHARVYRPRPGPRASTGVNKLAAWKSRVSWATQYAVDRFGWRPVPAGVPVECSIDLYVPFASTTALCRIRNAENHANPIFWQLKATLPDRDNLDKAVLDTITALGSAGVWNDDGQVALGRIVKWYSTEHSGALIHLATGAALSNIARPDPTVVPRFDRDREPPLTGGI